MDRSVNLNYRMEGVDVVKSVAGLYKHMRGGVVSLTNVYVDIDGECEVEKKTIVCHRIHLKGISISRLAMSSVLSCSRLRCSYSKCYV